MTTDLSKLHTETQRLIGYGAERYEDAITIEAARLALRDIGAIPPWAWGKLDWSPDWRLGWGWALDERITEARWGRDAIGDIAAALFQIAADYEHTDIDATLSFRRVNADLRPYVDAVGATATTRYRPGGLGDLPPYYQAQQNQHLRRPEKPEIVYPPNDPRWNKLTHEPGAPELAHYERHDAGAKPVPDDPVGGDGSPFVPNTKRYVIVGRGGIPGMENDGLDNFVRDHQRTLLELEGIIDAFGHGHRKPLSDIIVRAWHSSPSIIKNRTDLLGMVADTYNRLGADMSEATDILKSYWDSRAARVFYQRAGTIQKYVGDRSESDSIAGQVTWLATEGKKAANCLQGLRIAYANLGFDHIKELTDELKSYQEAVVSTFAACQNPEEKLLAAIDKFVDLLIAEEKGALAVSQGLLKIEDQVRREGPDLDSRLHLALRPPHTEVGNDEWRRADGWKPSQ